MTQSANTTESYTYDPVGNRLSSLGVSPYVNNTSNELTSTPNASYSYDYNGNTTSKTVSGGTTNYRWDYENRLTSVALPGTSGSITFKYDPLGRRIQKAFTQNSTTTTTNYLYDGSNAVADIDQNGNVLARYAETQNIDEPLAELRSGTTSYYEADGLGSVTSLTSGAGAIANTYTYDSFGNLTASNGSIANRFQYTAREFDSESGLYYYRARYYDQSTGRFLTEDPVQFQSDKNFYRYVRNRPTLLRDPTGRWAGGGGLNVAGVIGALGAAAAAEGSCLVVHDNQGNWGLLCCLGLGAGVAEGADVGVTLTGIACPTCKTICDLQGGFVAAQAFGAIGAGLSGGGTISIGMNQITLSGNVGPAGGIGGGIAVLGGSCTLRLGGKKCNGCPAKKE